MDENWEVDKEQLVREQITNREKKMLICISSAQEDGMMGMSRNITYESGFSK